MFPLPDDFLIFSPATPWDEVQLALEAAGIGDGLPLVPPTPDRMERMLAGVADRAQSYGLVPPLFGDLTAAAVAYCCVVAGCAPGAVPVVLTAVAASLAPEFNLLGIQTTTGTPTVAVVVHGPAGAALGMNAGTNCLGPGNRANASIGRAVQLALVMIGGARPGIGDMATMGQPGKYGFCFAEHDAGALPPLHVRRGFAATDSAVTVLGVSGTMEVVPPNGDPTVEGVLGAIRGAMLSAREASGGRRASSPREHFALIPPEIAEVLAREDWDASTESLYFILTGGPGIKMTYLPLWCGGTASVTRMMISL